MRDATTLIKRTFWSLNADHATSFAAAIAYYTLFSIFPMALLFVSLSGYFMTDAQRLSLVNRISEQIGAVSTSEIYRQVQTATNGRAGLGLVGLVGTLWTASSVFTAVRTGLNAVWHVHTGRRWFVAKALDLAGVATLAAMLAIALTATVAVTRAADVSRQVLGAGLSDVSTVIFGITLTAVPVVIVFLTFWLLYIIASPPWITWRHSALGAGLVSVGFVLISFGFGLYVRYFGRFDRVYGSLGAVIAFLFYAFLIGLLILIGAEVTEQYMELSDGY